MTEVSENQGYLESGYTPVLFVVIIVTLIVIVIENYYRIILSKRYASKRMPVLPLVGSVHLFIQKNFLHVFLEWSRKFKEPYYLRLCFIDHYFTQDANEIKEILTNPKTIEKGYVYSFLQWVAPDNILITREEIWRRKRRYFSKGFNQRRLNSLVPIFDKNCARVIEQLRAGDNIDLLEIIERNIIENYFETMIGLDVTNANDKIKKLYVEMDTYKHTQMIESSATRRYFRPWLFFDFIYANTSEGREVASKMKDFNRMISYVIRERRTFMSSRENEHIDEVEKNLVDLMIEEDMDEKDMLVEVGVFGAGATETTGVALGMTLTLLGMHPEIQEKVYKELIDATGNATCLDHNDLVKLKYLEMVINEAMRLFPPVPLIIREATADLNLDGKIIPKGTNTILSIIDVHYSEKYWKNPKKFDPDRFSSENSAKRSPFTFLPFSGGPRNCIAAKFAMMLMKTVLAKIIKEFQLSSSNKSLDDIKIESQITTVVTEGMECKFTPRSTF